MKITQAIIVLTLWASAATAQPWIPFDCKTRYEESWNKFAQGMRKASPGSQIYAPKPFPQNEPDIIDDFKYSYRQMLKEMSPGEISQEEWPLYSALEKNRLAFRIIRVENWAPDRCRPDQQRDFLYVLYITDRSSGNEVARAFINQNGLLSGWTIAPEEEDANHVALYRASAAPRLEDALAQAYARFGIKGSRAQYVTTWGNPQCPLPSPCVSFQAAGRNYLFRAGDLVVFSPGTRAYTGADLSATRSRMAEISSSVNPEKEWLVSIADDHWVLAEKVKPLH
jgi:hypothetical protein